MDEVQGFLYGIGTGLLVFSGVFGSALLSARKSCHKKLQKAQIFFMEGKIDKAYREAYPISEPFFGSKKVSTEAKNLVTKIESKYKEDIEKEFKNSVQNMKIVGYETDLMNGEGFVEIGETSFKLEDVSPTYKKYFCS